jgi:hypothetical protein
MAVVEINHDQLEYLIGIHYKAKIPMYIWGATGIGKSDCVRKSGQIMAKETQREYIEWNKISKEKKREVEENLDKYFILMDIRLSQMDPSDLKGLPGLDGDVCDWKIPYWLSILCKENARGIAFFDEINLAPPSIQAAAYQLILDRALGEVSITDGVSLLAAGNRIEDKANVFDLPLPLQNRFTHATLKPPRITDDPTEGWTKWALDAKVDSRIVTFLQARPTFLSMAVKANSNERSFCTPRSWGKYCSALIKDIPTTQLKTIHLLASVSVGGSAASEFISFLKFQKKINLQDILANPKKVKAMSSELDMIYALIGVVDEWYADHHKKDDLDKIFKLASYMNDEFAILMLRFIKNKNTTSFRNNAMKLSSWDPIADKYGKYLLT